jgi:hypothetical protein
MPPEAARLTEPSDEETRLRAYFISEHRRRFALPGDADSDWREAKQQLLSKSGELSGRSTITTEEPSEIPARTEEIALPAVVTSAETEVALIEEGQPVSHEAYRKAEPNGELPPLTEPVFESPVGPAVEQTAEVSSPVIRKASELAEVLAISELWTTSAVPAEESGASPVVAEAATTPTVEPVVAPEIEPIRQEQPIPNQTLVSAMEPSIVEAINDTPSHFPSATANESVSPQVTTAPTMPEHIEMTEVPTAPLMKTPTAEHESRPASSMHTAVQLTFSLEIASMQLTPAFKVGALQVRTTSKIVTMRLAPHQGSQPGTNPEVSFEIAKIQPPGGAFGNIRMTPSQQEKPTAVGSPSFMVEGSQLVPNFEGTSVQLTPSQQAKASVLVTVPFEISTIEFSPSFEIASVVLNSSSKQVFVHLPGAEPSPGEGRPMFEIANLEVSESGDINMMQLNLLDHSPKET